MPSSRQRLFVIDGPATAYQSFHAIPDFVAPDGAPVGAIYGFAGMLRKLLRQEAPEFLVVAWDHHSPTFRDALYDDYKGTRSPMPQDLVAQLTPIKELIAAFRIPFLELPGFEADDIMATLARVGVENALDVVLVTRDKDCKQLLGPHVRLYDAKTAGYFDEAKLKETSGLSPAQWADYQALVGDSSDNIKGAAGIGPKTATKLLTDLGSLAGIYANLEQVDNQRTRQLLVSARGAVEQATLLVTLRTDVPLEAELAGLKYPGPDSAALDAMYLRLGFKGYLDRNGAASGAWRAGSTDATAGRAVERRHGDALLVTDAGDLAILAGALRRATQIGIFAATGDHPTAPVAGFAFAWDRGQAAYVPIASPGLALPRDIVARALLPVLRDAGIAKVAHDAKRTLEALAVAFADGAIPVADRDSLVCGSFDDTTLAAYLLDSNRRSYDLDDLARDFLGQALPPREDVLGKGRALRTFPEASLARVCEFACESADLTLELAQLLLPRLEAEGLAKVYREVELPLMPVLARMERAGLLLDGALLATISTELSSELASLESAAHAEAGRAFNLGSLKELQQILFTERGLKPTRSGKSGPSTDAESLTEIHAASGDPLCEFILRWRECSKLKSTYTDSLPHQAAPATGRVHTILHQSVAATGRLSSSEPNLQNIPVRTELGRRIRSAFVAAPGCALISGDYSQIELRVMAHFSGDENMRGAFERGEDIHNAVAALVEGVATTAVTREMRHRAKAVNFGILYGQSAFGLARGLDISKGDAARFIERYFASFPGVRAWIEATIATARSEGEVRTLAGRRRPIHDLDSRNAARRNLGERTAVNTVVQGSAADILKLAMIALERRIHREHRPERMLLQIHDELLLECPAEAAPAAAATLKEELERIVTLSVPLVVSTAIGTSWGGLEK